MRPPDSQLTPRRPLHPGVCALTALCTGPGWTAPRPSSLEAPGPVRNPHNPQVAPRPGLAVGTSAAQHPIPEEQAEEGSQEGQGWNPGLRATPQASRVFCPPPSTVPPYSPGGSSPAAPGVNMANSIASLRLKAKEFSLHHSQVPTVN